MQKKDEQVPVYQGEWCDSRCDHQRDCKHAEHFDHLNGIRRLHLDFPLKHN